MDNADIRERVRFLQMQIVGLQKANRAYLKKRSHSPRDVDAHRTREERLQKILEELIKLSGKTKAA